VSVFTTADMSPFFGPVVGKYVVDVLNSLGYVARLVRLPVSEYAGFVPNSKNRVQVAVGFGWTADYPAPYGFFQGVLTCESFIPGTGGNANWALFCDPAIDRQMAQAVQLQATDPQAARAMWQGVDRALTQAAPWVPMVNDISNDLVSARVGNYQVSPLTGPLLGQLWVR
jgi:ABC-type transport system substrate-binding protein